MWREWNTVKDTQKDIERQIPEQVDIVYHLGEYSRVEKSFEDIERVWDLNQFGTFAVPEFARRRGAKLIYAGSSTKFGDKGLGRDQSPYAWSKASMTDLVKNYGEWFGLKYAITYFYNVYGPRERSNDFGTVVAIFKEQYARGLPRSVVFPGNQARIFTHVDDIVDALVLVGENGSGDGYGIGGEEKLTILELAKLFGDDVVMLPERQGNRMEASLILPRLARSGGLREDRCGMISSSLLQEQTISCFGETRTCLYNHIPPHFRPCGERARYTDGADAWHAV